MTIINRSEIVGRPLAAMLANDGATIYSVDVDSIFLFKRGALRKTESTPEEAVKRSDVVITVRRRGRGRGPPDSDLCFWAVEMGAGVLWVVVQFVGFLF